MKIAVTAIANDQQLTEVGTSSIFDMPERFKGLPVI